MLKASTLKTDMPKTNLLKTNLLKAKVINTLDNSVYAVDLTPRSARQSECLIGRHPNCDLVLDGPAVSRVHGRLLFEDDACFFTDLGSTDGSRLNNQTVYVNQGYAIAPDDIIRIGEFALIIEAMMPAALPEPEHQTSLAWPQSEITARCIRIIQETQDVKTFRFVAEPAVLFDFKPGQFVCITLPIADESGKPITRAYSISSSPATPHTLDITVKRVGPAGDELPKGLASNWLHDTFEIGMTLQMQGPFGAFNCVDQPADKLLLLSAGSGITPMMAMAQWLCDRSANIDITFIHTARSAQDIIFRQRLELLAAQHPNFKLAFTLTKNTPTVAWSGYRGRLNPALLAAICPDFSARTAFVCGPNSFMSSTKDLLKSEGFPMENYFEESFGERTGSTATSTTSTIASATTPAPVPSDEAKTTIEDTLANDAIASPSSPVVAFAISEKVVPGNTSDTLLEIAEEAGLDIASGCRMGSCGACKYQLVSGEVCYEIEPRGLSEEEKSSQYVLACVAKPIGQVVLNL